MKSQRYNELIKARTENLKKFSELRNNSTQIDTKITSKLLEEDIQLTKLIQEEISKLKK